MNLPNILTLSRIGFAAIIVCLLLNESTTSYILAAVFFLIASITDFYDGYLAKKMNLISDFGKIMDPIADKVLMLSIFCVIAHIGIIAWWMVIVIALREIIITIDRLRSMKKGQVLAAEKAGKIKTVFQMTTVSVILIYLIVEQLGIGQKWFNGIQGYFLLSIQVLMILTVFLTITSGISYWQSKSRR